MSKWRQFVCLIGVIVTKSGHTKAKKSQFTLSQSIEQKNNTTTSYFLFILVYISTVKYNNFFNEMVRTSAFFYLFVAVRNSIFRPKKTRDVRAKRAEPRLFYSTNSKFPHLISAICQVASQEFRNL